MLFDSTMEARASSMGLQMGTRMNTERFVRKPNSPLQFFQNYGAQRLYQIPISCHLLAKNCGLRRPESLKVPCSSEKSQAPVLEAGGFTAMLNEPKVIKNNSQEIESYLNGRCIYLVGMMGSGKTTVGKVLAEALGYSFYDCDTLIEEAVGGSTVAEIFRTHGESFFRDNETEALFRLSTMHRLVISTGGGAVVRPVNRRHMQKGVSIWLDVPLEALARRITAIGTNSRPLLHHELGDPYSKTMKRLSALFEERGEAYAKADIRVSLENIATKIGSKDMCNLTPTEIAAEALLQIENFLQKYKDLKPTKKTIVMID